MQNQNKNNINGYDKNTMYLPFAGTCIIGNCEALSSKYNLFSQCLNPHTLNQNEFKVCSKCFECNAIATNGSVKARLSVPLNKYVSPSGKKPIHYGNVIRAKNYTELKVRNYAAKRLGAHIHLPDIHFKKNRVGNGNSDITIATKTPKIITHADNIFYEDVY